MTRRSLSKPAARSQRGFALIAILALAALITAFLISSALNRSSADVLNEREQRSMDALRQAKAALIAYAAAVDWRLQSPTAQPYLQPGALPYPDIDGDGKSDPIGTGITPTGSIIGRLPWVTMGIDDLRDASGEKIWYALSHDFRKLQCTNAPNSLPLAPVGCTRINSDTQGQLTATGAVSASNVVAVLIAPGSAIAGQARPSNTPSDYVESYAKGDGIHFTFTTNARPDNQLNDRILVITQQELMAAVEPVVAARLERDIAPLLQGYYALWGAYPFPAPFVGGPAPSNPGRTLPAYKGATTTAATGGLLPLTTDPTFLSWSAPVTVTEKPGGTGNAASSSCTSTWSGGGAGGVSGGPSCTLTSVDCSHTTSSTVNCEIRYSGSSNDRPLITLSAALRNGALSFPKPVTYFDAFMTDDSGGPVQEDPDPPGPTNTGQWSWSRPPDPGVTSFFQPFVDFNAASPSDGSAIVSFTGRLHNAAGVGNRITITIAAPTTYDTITSGDWGVSPDTAWFVANEWFRQTYYAVSPGFLPAGGNACTNPPPCLQVSNLRPSYTPPSNNKRAVLVLAGRALNGAARPTSSLADYFENANLTAANGATPYVYENRVGAPTSINDRVVVISP